jgi:DNA-binding transcriptional LysR family regulator
MAVLLEVVDAGSLSAASRRLAMPLPTVSRRISDLEAALGTQLLIRSTRRLSLTQAGRDYAAACRQILSDISDAERAAAGEFRAPRGELLVSAPVVFGRLHVLPILVEFLKAYPEVSARLVLGDRIVNLLDEHIDLALRIGPLPDSGLIATHVGDIRRVVCASPDYLAVQGTPRYPRDLAGHPCVNFHALGAGNGWRFVIDDKPVVVPIVPRLTVSTAEAAIDAAITGLGPTCVLSYQVDAARRDGKLVTILERFEPPPLPVNLVYTARDRLPLKLRALLDFAAPRLRERLRPVSTGQGPRATTAAPTARSRKRRRPAA